MYYVYLLKSIKDDSIYVGYTDDLKRRLKEHNDKKNLSTKHRAPFRLVYYESYSSKSDAKYRESQLKKHAGAMTALKRRIENSLQ